MNFIIVLQEIASKYGEGNCFLVVRAFACRRINRGDNTVGAGSFGG